LPASHPNTTHLLSLSLPPVDIVVSYDNNTTEHFDIPLFSAAPLSPRLDPTSISKDGVACRATTSQPTAARRIQPRLHDSRSTLEPGLAFAWACRRQIDLPIPANRLNELHGFADPNYQQSHASPHTLRREAFLLPNKLVP
jgi:hypothetical protein